MHLAEMFGTDTKKDAVIREVENGYIVELTVFEIFHEPQTGYPHGTWARHIGQKSRKIPYPKMVTHVAKDIDEVQAIIKKYLETETLPKETAKE